jgi:hypothetical protein
LIPKIRAVSNAKLAFSIPIAGPWDANSAFARNQLRPYVDFYDFHLYHNVTTADIDGYWDIEHEYKPLVIGEFGSAAINGQAAQESVYNSVRTVVNYVRNDGRHLAGALNWAIRDQGPTNDAWWGMWTANREPRNYLINIFKQFPSSR